MTWPAPEFLLLLAGLITVAIALLPVRGVAENARWVALALGGSLVVIALVTPSLSRWIDPRVMILAPVVALIALGLVLRSAVQRRHHPPARLLDLERPLESESDPLADPADDRPLTAATAADPAADPADLYLIARQYPTLWPVLAANPATYPELGAWLADRGYPSSAGAASSPEAKRNDPDVEGAI